MKKNLLLPILSLLLVCFAISNASAGNDKVDLKLKVEKGHKFSYESNINSTISQEVMGTNQTMVNNMSFTYGYEVMDVSDNMFTIKVTYKRVYLYSYNDQTGANEFDSDKDSEAPAAQYKQFANIIGLSYQAKMNEYGKVQEIIGADEFVEELIAKMKPGADKLEDMTAALKASYNDEAFKSECENVFAVFPEKEVAAGDSWEEEKDQSGRFPMKITSTYNFVKFKKNKASFEVDAKMKSDETKTTEINDMEFAYKMDGTQTGEYDIDASTGLLKTIKVSSNIAGDMEIVTGVMAGQAIPMSVKTEIEGKVF